jgi:hypothetical protein
MPSEPAEPHRRTRITQPNFFRSSTNVNRVSLYAILKFLPCTASVTWSSLTSQPIGLSRRVQAEFLAADELPRLRTWTGQPRPPLTPTRTSTRLP